MVGNIVSRQPPPGAGDDDGGGNNGGNGMGTGQIVTIIVREQQEQHTKRY